MPGKIDEDHALAGHGYVAGQSHGRHRRIGTASTQRGQAHEADIEIAPHIKHPVRDAANGRLQLRRFHESRHVGLRHDPRPNGQVLNCWRGRGRHHVRRWRLR
jgi:hypothetical protein